MKSYILLLTGILLLLIFRSGNAQDLKLLHNASEVNLQNHIFYLASDSLQGRGINTPEMKTAAEYLRKNLREMELISPENGFFQPFILTSYQFNAQNSFLRVFNKKGKRKHNIINFIALNQKSNVVDIEGELIFAGFGPESLLPGERMPGSKDLKGKIVLYSAGTSQSLKDGNSHRWNSPLERKKMDELLEAGAKALILVTSVQDTANSVFRQIERVAGRQNFSLDSENKKESPEIFIITPEMANLLTGKRMGWSKLLNSHSTEKSLRSNTVKNNRVHIRSVLTESKVKTANVIGIVEGSDSLLRNECVLFMAHYDHLGIGKNNELFNGADDNASGVATLLEVANMFSRLEQKPRRSILFIFPSAEEIGLFGSDYYTRNPVFPLENTVTCINLDMVGRVYEERDSIWDHSPKQVKDFNGIYTLMNDFNTSVKTITEKACSHLELVPDFSLPQKFFYTSDHYHFHKNQVPVLNLSTGYSADYHKSTDTANRISIKKMKRIANLCFLVGMELGNQ